MLLTAPQTVLSSHPQRPERRFRPSTDKASSRGEHHARPSATARTRRSGDEANSRVLNSLLELPLNPRVFRDIRCKVHCNPSNPSGAARACRPMHTHLKSGPSCIAIMFGHTTPFAFLMRHEVSWFATQCGLSVWGTRSSARCLRGFVLLVHRLIRARLLLIALESLPPCLVHPATFS